MKQRRQRANLKERRIVQKVWEEQNRRSSSTAVADAPARPILACDPGSENMGLAVVEARPMNTFGLLAYWKIHAPLSWPLDRRLDEIGSMIKGPLEDAILTYDAAALAIEEPPEQWREHGIDGKAWMGRKLNSHSVWVLGQAAGIVRQAWHEAVERQGMRRRPVGQIPVGVWRRALSPAYRVGPTGDTKAEAVRLAKLMTGIELETDVAEAALMGWACTLRPSLLVPLIPR